MLNLKNFTSITPTPVTISRNFIAKKAVLQEIEWSGLLSKDKPLCLRNSLKSSYVYTFTILVRKGGSHYADMGSANANKISYDMCSAKLFTTECNKNN